MQKVMEQGQRVGVVLTAETVSISDFPGSVGECCIPSCWCGCEDDAVLLAASHPQHSPVKQNAPTGFNPSRNSFQFQNFEKNGWNF